MPTSDTRSDSCTEIRTTMHARARGDADWFRKSLASHHRTEVPSGWSRERPRWLYNYLVVQPGSSTGPSLTSSFEEIGLRCEWEKRCPFAPGGRGRVGLSYWSCPLRAAPTTLLSSDKFCTMISDSSLISVRRRDKCPKKKNRQRAISMQCCLTVCTLLELASLTPPSYLESVSVLQWSSSWSILKHSYLQRTFRMRADAEFV
ncbi:hypothetical protein GGS23DRAFT_435614 [Durotheca rogersii]|uniref:uncharacterized protein n=1 Tax=Durotheca rogersii TaxID=419775 RepID=UPI002220C756|nr:uncharacterized protein GGS23DRAFT_435614 [Durotheca rogersii]KAI5865620.1 hypothetical protein GGS23DRAFT_435614 [Durotheca rogersii]